MAESSRPSGEAASPAPKIRAKGAGTPEWRNGHWWVRVSLPDGTRPRYRLCLDACDCESMSEARKLERCAAVSERKRAAVSPELAALSKAEREKRLTVQQFGEQWTEGRLPGKFGDVNGLKQKKSAADDVYRLKASVYPEIGAIAVAAVPRVMS